MTTANQKIRRLPGFRFEAQSASRENVLPRMDIALFVGFARSGPVGIPVVLESAEQFNTIFGKDLPLVWDREKGETLYAYLAPTVRAFFRNGGKRCWVIRVARLQPTTDKPENRACYNFFPLSGFACVRFGKSEPENILPAFARARSRGSWSDDLQIGTAVLARAVRFIKIDDVFVTSPDDKEKILYLEIPVNEPLKLGELLRLNFSDEGLILFLSADKIEDAFLPNPPPVGKKIVKVTSKRFVWLENLSAISSPPLIDSPPVISSPNDVQNVSVRTWTHREATSRQNILDSFFVEREAELRVESRESEGIEDAPPKVVLKFADLPLSKAPAAGSLLTTELYDERLCLQVEMVNVIDFETQATIEVTCRAMIYREDAENPYSKPQVERLAFELWIKNGEQSLVKLSDLAFNSGHERFWGNLPTDEHLYRFSVDEEQENPEIPETFEIPAWTQIGDAASFPLAGNGDSDAFYFPVFPTAFPADYLGSVILKGTKLQRDGLEKFDTALFLDEKLENTGLNNLLTDAEFVRYLSSRPRALRGIHAALVPETTINLVSEGSATNPLYASQSLDEATIVCVPDALHRGWFLQKDDDEIIFSPPVFSPPLRPEWWHFQDCRKPEIKPVSEPLWGNFLDCKLRVIKEPENLRVREEKVSTGKYTLVWDNAEEIRSPQNEALKFVLEESASPEFRLPDRIYAGEDTEFQVSGRGAGIYYYRVRVEIGSDFSDWSIGLAIKVPAAENWVANSTSDYDSDVLFAVQRALLRMCAARGDLFAVLDLPEHYDKDAAITHVATLKTTKGLTSASSGIEPFSADEAKALSFGAVYHPWLMTREDGFERVRNVPPSGNICGVMAHRAIRRGAWIAPANEALQGVFGLATAFGRESFLDFQDGLVNLVRQEPTGFLVLDSDTLSDDFDLRSINVRRLLSLLRRLALKRGAEYVFEPNDERFRRQVQRGFASLLDVMFTRGAFAGTTPATSYQVVVSDTVNNFQSVEQGRFIVELRIAPSQPLKFVTVRLMQTGGRSTVTEVF